MDGVESAVGTLGAVPAVKDGGVAVRVADDRMTAYLLISPPAGGGRAVTAEQAMAALSEAGVVYGIDQQAVEQAVMRHAGPNPADPPKAVPVAMGLPPTPGRDAWIEYLPSLLEPGGTPRVRPDDSVDLYDLGLVHNVVRGTRLAHKHPADPGEPGINVLGEPVPQPPVKDVRLRPGKGVILSEDGLDALADLDGHAVLRNGSLSISPVFEVRTDVGTETGNIEFVGSVVVRGNVGPGFWVKAEHDVEVFGGIEGSVRAGGNVHVHYGIQGSGRGTVEAGLGLRARFVENATVKAGGDVVVADGILHSRVECGGKVEVLGRRGSIIGGVVRARDQVSARVIGAALATQTEIAVGCPPEVREGLEVLRREIQELELAMRRTKQAIRLLKEQEERGGLSEEKSATLLRLVRGQYHQTRRFEEAVARKLELEQRLREARQAWVRAQDVCFPGVRVIIGSQVHLVADPLQRVRFFLNENEEVAFGPG